MRAELYDKNGKYIGAFDLPPFKVAPDALESSGLMYEPDGFPAVHLTNCATHTVLLSNPPKTPECNCGGVYSYREVNIHHLLDMHRIEGGRDKPLTRRHAK